MCVHTPKYVVPESMIRAPKRSKVINPVRPIQEIQFNFIWY